MEDDMARKEVFRSPADKARWLSEFLSTDIEKVATSDFAKLSYEFFCFVQGEKTTNLMGPGIYTDTEGKRKMFGLLQQEMSKILDSVVKWKKEEADSSQYDDPRLIPGAWDPEKPKARFNLRYAVYVRKDELWLEHDRYELVGPMCFSLLNLLSKFALSSIKTCANEPCGNFFIQTTKREKIYCSQRCAWQQTSRKARRAGGGDEYRKKQRKVMRKRYVEDQKKKHGPNVKVNQRRK
jgi:hypothetical protein